MAIVDSVRKRITGTLAQSLSNAVKDYRIWHDNVSRFFLVAATLRYLCHLKLDAYKYLENNFLKDNIFRFGDICLPKIDLEHRKMFMAEFGDLIAPYLWTNRSTIWPGSSGEGTYEQYGVSVNSGDIIIDVGANMGMFSAYAASVGATVYAFEPMPVALNYLRKTININLHLSGTINLIPYAIMDYSGKVTIESGNENFGDSSAVLDRKTGKKTIVACTTLDEWVEANDLAKVDFIKADIEGAERLLLRGATRVLQVHRPRLAICNYHCPDDPQVLTEIILRANPDYTIYQNKHKLFARCQ